MLLDSTTIPPPLRRPWLVAASVLVLVGCRGDSDAAKGDGAKPASVEPEAPAVTQRIPRPGPEIELDAASFTPGLLASPLPAEAFAETGDFRVHFSRDGRAVAVRSQDQTRLVRGFEEVDGYAFFSEVAWSPAGELGFISAVGGELTGGLWSSDAWFVVVGARRYGPFARAYRLRFDASGGFSAQVRTASGQWAMLVDGEVGRNYQEIPSLDLTYAADGRLAAYLGRPAEGQPCVIVGKDERCFPGVMRPAVSGDGSVVAVATRDAVDRASVVIGDYTGPTFASVSPPVLSHDGRRWAYAAKDAEHAFVVHGESTGPSFDRVLDLRMGPDGELVVYTAIRGEQWFVVAGADEHPIPAPGDVVVSGDGEHYAARVAGQGTSVLAAAVLVDGVMGPPQPCVRYLRLSHSGTVGYLACDEGGERMIVGDVRGERYDVVWGLEFGPEDGQFAYLARRDTQEFVVTESATWGPFVDVGASDHQPEQDVGKIDFAPDGSVVFRALAEDGWHVFLSGQVVATADAVFEPFRFAPEEVGVGVRRGESYAWDVVALPTPGG